jgi:hypothetical protein
LLASHFSANANLRSLSPDLLECTRDCIDEAIRTADFSSHSLALSRPLPSAALVLDAIHASSLLASWLLVQGRCVECQQTLFSAAKLGEQCYVIFLHFGFLISFLAVAFSVSKQFALRMLLSMMTWDDTRPLLPLYYDLGTCEIMKYGMGNNQPFSRGYTRSVRSTRQAELPVLFPPIALHRVIATSARLSVMSGTSHLVRMGACRLPTSSASGLRRFRFSVPLLLSLSSRTWNQSVKPELRR